MDELSRARTELALLEKQARLLLKELLRVRAAVVMQRAKVDELIRTRPTAFNLLPTEILLSILDLDVRVYHHTERKYELAGVCRRWKNIIFGSPSLWTTIHVATSPSSIMTHLEWSRGAPLDIVIEAPLWSRSQHLALVPSLDIVVPLAHRWYKLSITDICGSDDDEEVDISLAEFIITRINHLQFPSLKYVAISYCDASLDFLSTARAPALEHLRLKEFKAEHTDFPPVTALQTLDLDFYGNYTDYPLFRYLIPTQALTKLSVSGELSPLPNSIHLPSLKLLEISFLTRARQFINAIMAPNLERFKYTSGSGNLPSVALRGFRSKFTSVRHLSFCGAELLYADTIALCEAFPGVRHVELKTKGLPHFFDPDLSDAPVYRPIDLWTELETLTLCGLHPKWLEPNQFSAWLFDRQALGMRRLHVKLEHLSGFNGPGQFTDFEFPRLYKVLKENCILELDDFPLTLPRMYLYMPVNSQLRVVSTPFPYAGLYSLYVCLGFATSDNRTCG